MFLDIDNNIEDKINLFSYVTRPQQWLRRAVYEYVTKSAPRLEPPCAVVHVRRADVVLHGEYARRYYALHEYVTAGGQQLKEAKQVLLFPLLFGFILRLFAVSYLA